ncbi:MAG TPA: metallophosphoesterase [Actinospica sp.]|jgi:3',5'-cyclic AMP phosphodiesterase CpdA|nr:metallophosphoesterase [Actinospica sp.]
MPGTLFAVSDVHVGYEENLKHVESLRPESAQDWLIVAGDVAERFTDVARALHTLRARFDKVIWVPGNHELWTPKTDPVQSRGEERYRQLVELCRRLDVLTPEDPYAVWDGEGGPVVIAPLFLLYDYSFHPPGTTTKEAGLAYAYETGIVCADEVLLHPDPYPTREDWCAARLEYTEKRLEERPDGLPTVLVNHFPLTREATRKLRYQEFAQWCGTTRTADWHTRFDAKAVVYGHLHIPRTTWEDGVRFEEVSLGYPREWQPRGGPSGLRRILPG